MADACVSFKVVAPPECSGTVTKCDGGVIYRCQDGVYVATTETCGGNVPVDPITPDPISPDPIVPPVSECTNGASQCGDDGFIYTCSGGVWTKTETSCGSDPTGEADCILIPVLNQCVDRKVAYIGAAVVGLGLIALLR